MIVEDIAAVDGLPLAGGGMHAADGGARPQHGEGVAREVQVGDGVQDEARLIAEGAGQRVVIGAQQLPVGNAGHGLEHQVLLIRDVHQQGVQLLAVVAPHVARALDELLYKLPAHGFRWAQGIGHPVGQVAYLRAVRAQGVGKGIVLALGTRQVGNVIKQHARQVPRRQLLQLGPRPVQQYPAKRAYFATNR